MAGMEQPIRTIIPSDATIWRPAISLDRRSLELMRGSALPGPSKASVLGNQFPHNDIRDVAPFTPTSPLSTLPVCRAHEEFAAGRSIFLMHRFQCSS
jgi:hypothetical protein